MVLVATTVPLTLPTRAESVALPVVVPVRVTVVELPVVGLTEKILVLFTVQ